MSLQYESYAPMAVRQLKSICIAAKNAHSGVHRIAVAHRLGTVGVGEGSVFVAVSSIHRAEALDACRYVIDELKATVPIWKKEVYDNGEVWKENTEFVGKKVCCGHKVKVED